MAFDDDPSATHDPSAGADPPAAWGDILNDNWAYLAGTWETYTPSWTGASGDPAIGNGTLTGRFLKMGKLGIIVVQIEMGSGTTFGSGDWSIGLPSGWTIGALPCQVIAVAGDAAGPETIATWTFSAGVTSAEVRGHGANADFDSATPHGWGDGDFLRIGPGILFLA